MSGQPSSSKSAATTVMPYVCVALLIPACSDTSVNVPSPLLRKSERSEEHTSELQSQSNLVCRLLLEKKKHIACRYVVIAQMGVATKIAVITMLATPTSPPAAFIQVPRALVRSVRELDSSTHRLTAAA